MNQLRRAAFAFSAGMSLVAGDVDVGGGEVDVVGLFFVHGMIGLMARRRWAAGLVGAVFVGDFVGVDLARRLAVFHGLLRSIRIIGGCGFVVLEATHAAFGFWLGPLVASTGIRYALGHGNLHGYDRSQ